MAKNFLDWFRGEDMDDDFNDFAPEPKRTRESRETRETTPSYESTPAEAEKRSKIVNMTPASQLAVVLVKPDRFENAAEIADHLKEGRTVVLNLEQTNKDVARRLVDFLSGVAYANEGKIKRVANSTYIITPFDVDLMGDLMDELETNGVYI